MLHEAKMEALEGVLAFYCDEDHRGDSRGRRGARVSRRVSVPANRVIEPLGSQTFLLPITRCLFQR
jgi:hypothetical protein